MAGQMKRKGKKGKVKTVEVKWKGKVYRAKPSPSPIRNRIIWNHVNEISHNNQYSY